MSHPLREELSAILTGKTEPASGEAGSSIQPTGTLVPNGDHIATGAISQVPDTLRKDDSATIADTTTAAYMNRPGLSEDAKAKAHVSRSKQWGIAKKDGGQTMPARWRRAGLKPKDFADPVNFRFPTHNKVHANNAMARFEQVKDEYSTAEQAIIRKRILAAQRRFGVEAVMKKRSPTSAPQTSGEPTDELRKQMPGDGAMPMMVGVDSGVSDYGAEDATTEMAEDAPMWDAMQALLESVLAFLQAKDALAEAAGGDGVAEQDISDAFDQAKTGALAIFAKYEGEEDTAEGESDTNADIVKKSAPLLAEHINFVPTIETSDLLSKKGARHSAPDMEHLSAIEKNAKDTLERVSALGGSMDEMKKSFSEFMEKWGQRPDASTEAENGTATPSEAAEGTELRKDAPVPSDEDLLRKRTEMEEMERRSKEHADMLDRSRREYDDLMSKARPRADDLTDGWLPVGAETDVETLQKQLLG